MKVPNILSKNNKCYVFVKQVNDDLLLYQNFAGGYFECFSMFDLGLNGKNLDKEYCTKWEK